jgi:hypothetical protein
LACLLALIVRFDPAPPEVTVFGENVALVLGGRPEMLSVTEVDPTPARPTPMVSDLLALRGTVRLIGEAEMVKSAFTVTVTVTEWLKTPEVPVTTTL